MLSYGAYAAIMFGTISVIVLIGAIILLKIPLPRLVMLLESVFRFKQQRNIGNDYVVIDVCDDKFELLDTISSRLPFVFALGMCILVAILVFIEGCIFSTRHVYSTKVCSIRTPNCYLFTTDLSAFKPLYNFVCEPDEPVIPSNMSASYAVCYGFVLPDQSSIDILNQLGVCTGILSLVESLYPLAYKFGREKYGRICLIILLVILVVSEIIVLSIQWNISFITIILVTLAEVLLFNIFFLQYRRMTSSRHLDQVPVGSYINLDDVN
jgi:hypothetical protein